MKNRINRSQAAVRYFHAHGACIRLPHENYTAQCENRTSQRTVPMLASVSFFLLLLLSEVAPYECRHVRIYQLYFEEADLSELYSDTCYRGLQLSAQGLTRPGDLNAAGLWPKLHDPHFQKRICEFGGMIALTENLSLHPWSWVGFTSWRERKKGFGNRINFSSLEQRLKQDEDVIYFWNDGEGIRPEEQGRLYHQMENAHPGAMAILNMLFIILFNRTLPPLPENPEPWIYSSTWIMSTRNFQSWMIYVKLFIEEFDKLFSHRPCPFGYTNLAKGRAGTAEEYVNRVCYCFILERLINIWVQYLSEERHFLTLRRLITQISL